MDTLASLALATEPPVPDLLKRAPHGRNEYIITKVIFSLIRKCSNTYLDRPFINWQSFSYQSSTVNSPIFSGENFIPEYADNLDTFIVENMVQLPNFLAIRQNLHGHHPQPRATIGSHRLRPEIQRRQFPALCAFGPKIRAQRGKPRLFVCDRVLDWPLQAFHLYFQHFCHDAAV